MTDTAELASLMLKGGAELLEAEIDKSNDVMKCFVDNADRLSREAGTEGITKSMTMTETEL